MSIFTKNTSHESRVVAIEHRFAVGDIAYQWPEENISAGSIIFVNPGQHALLIAEGRIAEVLEEGRHPLITENFPFLSKLTSVMYNGSPAYRCRLVFINTEKEVQMKWGTRAPLPVRDPMSGRFIKVRGRGSLTARIDNPSVFYVKTMGQLSRLTIDSLEDYIFAKAVESITAKIATAIQTKNIPMIQIAAHYSELSEAMYEQIVNDQLFEKYGLRLSLFSINDISMGDDDWEALQKYENEYLEKIREVDILKYKGDIYDKELSHDVLKAAAQNEGNGNMMNMGMGLGMGFGVGAGFGGMMNNMSNNMMNPGAQSTNQTILCPNCRKPLPATAEFCSFCGGRVATKAPDNVCSKCGAPNDPNAKFCGKCGNLLKEEPKTIECPNCHASNNANMKFCGSCGSPLQVTKKCPQCGAEVSGAFCGTCGTKVE